MILSEAKSLSVERIYAKQGKSTSRNIFTIIRILDSSPSLDRERFGSKYIQPP